MSLEHYFNKRQAACLQNLLIPHQLTMKYFLKQPLVQNMWSQKCPTEQYLMTVDLSFCFVIIYESWSVDELDFRCKLVLIQCNNRSVAHLFHLKKKRSITGLITEKYSFIWEIYDLTRFCNSSYQVILILSVISIMNDVNLVSLLDCRFVVIVTSFLLKSFHLKSFQLSVIHSD